MLSKYLESYQFIMLSTSSLGNLCWGYVESSATPVELWHVMEGLDIADSKII